MFRSYQLWCDHVKLPTRPQSQSEWFDTADPFSDEACNVIVSELALSYLIWTEAHNLRHLPELLNFLFWVMRFSSVFEDAANVPSSARGSNLSVPYNPETVRDITQLCSLHLIGWQPVEDLRQARSKLRQSFSAQIEDWRDVCVKEGVEPTLQFICQSTRVEKNDAQILRELVLNGDGGDFLDLVVQPIFNFLATEVTLHHSYSSDT